MEVDSVEFEKFQKWKGKQRVPKDERPKANQTPCMRCGTEFTDHPWDSKQKRYLCPDGETWRSKVLFQSVKQEV